MISPYWAFRFLLWTDLLWHVDTLRTVHTLILLLPSSFVRLFLPYFVNHAKTMGPNHLLILFSLVYNSHELNFGYAFQYSDLLLLLWIRCLSLLFHNWLVLGRFDKACKQVWKKRIRLSIESGIQYQMCASLHTVHDFSSSRNIIRSSESRTMYRVSRVS